MILGWERLSLTILMSQYDIIMYITSMQSEIYLLNLYWGRVNQSLTLNNWKQLLSNFQSFGATFEQLFGKIGATFWENWSNLWTDLFLSNFWAKYRFHESTVIPWAKEIQRFPINHRFICKFLECLSCHLTTPNELHMYYNPAVFRVSFRHDI